MKYQTLNERFPEIPVKKDGVSLTVPDMSFTPREIIQKFSRGEKVPLGFQGLYDSEDVVENDRFMATFDEDPQLREDDPTRDPSFDFGDYVEHKHALEQRNKERAQRSKVKKSFDSKRKASDEETSASASMKRETTSEEAKASPPGQ